MKYRVTLVIVRVVEAGSEEDAVNEAWYWAWDEAGASNPFPEWADKVEPLGDGGEGPPC